MFFDRPIKSNIAMLFVQTRGQIQELYYFYPNFQLRFKNKVKAKKDKRERRRMQIEKAKTHKVIDKGKDIFILKVTIQTT